MANAPSQSTERQWLPLCICVSRPTVKPFERVVDSVFTPFFTTGVAKPLFSGETALREARLRRPCARLRANRRDAMRGCG